jgi:hypothetical protein
MAAMFCKDTNDRGSPGYFDDHNHVIDRGYVELGG